MHWEEHPDIEAIQIGLNREDHHDDEYRQILYQNTPILQEPPEDLDETWRHGIFLNGGGVDEYLELARSYKQSAEALLESALKSGEPLDWGYPVLYAYRHSLELYFKVIGKIEKIEGARFLAGKQRCSSDSGSALGFSLAARFVKLASKRD